MWRKITIYQDVRHTSFGVKRLKKLQENGTHYVIFCVHYKHTDIQVFPFLSEDFFPVTERSEDTGLLLPSVCAEAGR